MITDYKRYGFEPLDDRETYPNGYGYRFGQWVVTQLITPTCRQFEYAWTAQNQRTDQVVNVQGTIEKLVEALDKLDHDRLKRKPR